MSAIAKVGPRRFSGAVPVAGAMILSTIVALPAFAEEGPPYYWGHMWAGGWFFGPIAMLVFFALLVAVTVAVVRWMSRDSRSGGSSALDVLRERFARGEIDKTEFEDRKKVLGA